MSILKNFVKSFFPKYPISEIVKSPKTTKPIPFDSFDTSLLMFCLKFSLMNQLNDRNYVPQFTREDIRLCLAFLNPSQDCDMKNYAPKRFKDYHVFTIAFYTHVTKGKNYTRCQQGNYDSPMITEAKRIGAIISSSKKLDFVEDNWYKIFTFSNIQEVYNEEFSSNCIDCNTKFLNIRSHKRCFKCEKDMQFSKVGNK